MARQTKAATNYSDHLHSSRTFKWVYLHRLLCNCNYNVVGVYSFCGYRVHFMEIRTGGAGDVSNIDSHRRGSGRLFGDDNKIISFCGESEF